MLILKLVSTLEIRSKLDDLGLGSLVRGTVAWEGDHVRLIISHKDSRGVSVGVVREISSCLCRPGVMGKGGIQNSVDGYKWFGKPR